MRFTHLLCSFAFLLPRTLKQMMRSLTVCDVNFLSLQCAVFCAECELISENNTGHCLACGSQALLSLSRVLGGSLRGQQTAHLIADAELDRLVRELLHTVPRTTPPLVHSRQGIIGELSVPRRHHVRSVGPRFWQDKAGDHTPNEPGFEIQPAEMD